MIAAMRKASWKEHGDGGRVWHPHAANLDRCSGIIHDIHQPQDELNKALWHGAPAGMMVIRENVRGFKDRLDGRSA
jgi:hypothetical protein